MTLIDTHCHLDADVFDVDREQVLQQSQAAGVGMIVIPAVMPSNFTKVAALSKQYAVMPWVYTRCLLMM